jgi:hypothetical protein
MTDLLILLAGLAVLVLAVWWRDRYGGGPPHGH